MNLAEYWRMRSRASVKESYKGLKMAKMPEDLAIYQRLIWETKPEVIVELGTYTGGSAEWFADQLLLQHTMVPVSPLVITVDTHQLHRPAADPLIWYVHGDLADEGILRQVVDLVAGRRTMVVEDTAHTYDTTQAALRLYGPLVSQGCYFVVEDTIVEDEENCPPEWYKPDSVVKAIDEHLGSNPEWERVPQDRYIVTMHQGGWLRRRS